MKADTQIIVYVLAALVVLLVEQSHGRVEPMAQVPQELQLYLNVCRSSGDLSQQSGQLVFWTVINQYASKFVQERPDMTPQQIAYFNKCMQQALVPLRQSSNTNDGKRKKRQTRRRRRVRREIRAMSVGQRRRYFRALNLLKRDTRLPPNIYDFISGFHSGTNINRAHFGPGFLPWHRLYLWILEYFLRQYNPTVTIPYWASVMDNDMQDAADSVVFSPAFFGSGVGEVLDGPFRTWSQINQQARIFRNVQGGALYTYEGIQRIVSRTSARDIVIPTAMPGSNSELQHGAAHIFISGNQDQLNSAAQDPIFFSHHAFVDYIWEVFKVNQRRNGIDPQSDYPFDNFDPRFNPLHRPTGNAGFVNLAGANEWTMEMGNLNAFSDAVAYEEIPSCDTRCANSRYLVCNNQLNPRRCMGRSRTELRGTGLLNEINLDLGGVNRKKRQATQNDAGQLTCPRKPFINDVDLRRIGFTPASESQHQNAWSYMPVKVVSKRPTEYTKFTKYSLGGYNPQLGLKNTFMTPSAQMKFSKCDSTQESVGKIKIVGYGLNAKSYAEEYVVVDNMHGVSESIGYLPVKRPEAGRPTEVMIAAFDTCGRVCKPYCMAGMSGESENEFSGAIRVSASRPLQYADTYGDATLQIWDIPNEASCPKINYDNVPVRFYCDYSDTWVWKTTLAYPVSTGSVGSSSNLRINQGHVMNSNTHRFPIVVTRSGQNRGNNSAFSIRSNQNSFLVSRSMNGIVGG